MTCINIFIYFSIVQKSARDINASSIVHLYRFASSGGGSIILRNISVTAAAGDGEYYQFTIHSGSEGEHWRCAHKDI